VVYRQCMLMGAAAMLAACSGFPRNEPGTGLGQITISSPRVETRERLINERREQEAWLRKQLDRIDTEPQGVSGEVDLRSATFLAAQLGINRDPTLKLDEINRQRDQEIARQAADDERALGTFRAVQRDQILADLRDKKLTVDEAEAALKKLGLSLSAPKPPAGASAPTASSGKPTSTVSLDKTYTPDGMPRRSGVGSTPIEGFHERLAPRHVVFNEINDVRLDALHDLDGRTVYRFNFDAEVIPDDDASAWAIARVRARIPLDAAKLDALLHRATDLHDRRLAEHLHSLRRQVLVRWRDECWRQEMESVSMGSGSWRLLDIHKRAFSRAMRCAGSELGGRTRRAMEAAVMQVDLANVAYADAMGGVGQTIPQWRQGTVRLADLVLDGPGASESDPVYKQRVAYQRRWAVWLDQVIEAYGVDLKDDSPLACLNDPPAQAAQAAPLIQAAPPALAVLPVPPVQAAPTVQAPALAQEVPRAAAQPAPMPASARPLPPGCAGVQGADRAQRFQALIAPKATGSVYSVTPKETIQKLSEVASNRKVTEILANLSAVTGTAGIGLGLQNIQAYDAFYSAMRRQPLVVGFTEVGSTCNGADCSAELVFGWVLGPSFQLRNDGKSVRFRHTPVQRSVAAELVLPAWIDQIELTPEVFWLNETGEVKTATRCRALNDKQCTAKKMVVQLPHSPLAALDAINVRGIREPRVDAYQYLDVEIGKKASVVVTGQNLWRSTGVLIGGQHASLVTVLPDNSGVVATFDEIAAPYGADKSRGPRRPTEIDGKAAHVPLRVVTSEGQVEAGRVAVHRGTSDAPQKAQVVLGAVPRIVAGTDHTFELSVPLAVTDEAFVEITSPQDRGCVRTSLSARA